jgi:toxin ParE1/3/4
VNPRGRTRLAITARALSNFAEIRDYSSREWGTKTAERYLDDLEAGLQRILDQPNLLSDVPDIDIHLKFYRVRQHLFICDFKPGSIVVLTVVHGSMDLISRLAELQPTLASEVALLHKQVHARTGKKSRTGGRPGG